MPVVAGTDYVLSPKTTWPFGRSGIVQGLLLGLPGRLVMLPRDAIGGAGRTVTTTRFSLGGKPLLEAIEGVLADPSTTVSELEDLVLGLAAGHGDAMVLELAGLKALRVKNGFFSRGIYWKQPEHSGWRGLPLAGKAVGAAFENFYRAQLRE